MKRIDVSLPDSDVTCSTRVVVAAAAAAEGGAVGGAAGGAPGGFADPGFHMAGNR
jgi:hypothetical protein